MQNSVVERRLYFNTDKLRFGALHNLRTTINTQTQTNAFQVIPHLQSLQLWDRSSSHHSRKQPWEINIRLNPKQASRWNKGRNSPVNIWSIIKHLLPSLKQGITVLRQVDRHFEPCQCNWSEKRRTSGLEPGMSQSLSRATRETREVNRSFLDEEMKEPGNEVVFFSLLACLEPVVQLTMTSKGKSFKEGTALLSYETSTSSKQSKSI